MENVQNFWQQKRNRVVLIVCVVLLAIILLIWQSFLSSGDHVDRTTQESSQPSPTGFPLNLVPSTKGPDRVAGELLVKFKTGVSQETITAALTRYHATIQKTIPGINTTVLSVPKGQEEAIRQQLQKDGLVQYSEPNYIRKIQFVPNDTNFTQQWGLANTAQTITIDTNGNIKSQKGTVNDDIHAEAAWDVSKGDGVKVAVLDTGINLNHPDLAGKVILQKVFVTTAATTIEDQFGHGTHVAGIIAADTNNGQGVAGVCPNCQLLIGKAMDDQGNGIDSDMTTAITWAADNGAKVINISVGGANTSQTEDAAITYAWNKGAIIVAAAGNNNSTAMFYPAASPNVISVAATDNLNARASFSDFGPWVDLAAPGLAILSTLPNHAYGMQQGGTLKTNYDFLSGTSMAAPIVSGVAALVWASPYGTSNAAVVQRLFTTADKIPGTGTNWANGLVNAQAAVGSAPTPTQNPLLTPTAGVNPTLFCLGSCPTTPPNATPQPTTATTPGVSPSTTQTAPTIDPCATMTQQSVTSHHSRHKKKHKSNNSGNGLISDLLKFLQQLFDLLMQLIGSTPPSDGTSPTPTPSISVSPTTVPCPSGTPTITPMMSPTPLVSTTPSLTMTIAPTSTLAATMTPILTPTPTIQPSVTMTMTPTPSGTLTPTLAATATLIPTITQLPTVTPLLSTTSVPTTEITLAPTVTVAPTSAPNNNGIFQNFINAILKFLQDIFNFFISLLKGL